MTDQEIISKNNILALNQARKDSELRITALEEMISRFNATVSQLHTENNSLRQQLGIILAKL